MISNIKIPKLNKFESTLDKFPKLNIIEYKRFLLLVKLYPNSSLVPTKEIDNVWHIHLKNELMYLYDCKSYFGYELKHKQIKNIEKQTYNFLVTKGLWEALYNSPYGELSDMAFCGVQGDGGGVETGETK